MLNRSETFFANGLQFSCTGCHACCRHEEGYVFLSETDVAKICAHLRIPPSLFRKKYTREVSLGGVSRLSLTETPEHDCIFWSDGCTIYPVRPLQCSSYPFWPQNLGTKDSWDEEATQCPGMNQGELHGAEKIANILTQLADRKLLSR
ncbi:YkgJ family cysteine cluster protein [Candidatus Haliotispira prima]|uniref:YkgJ family cysteine cluster protein n=1 Tax=Candidatus Haliotispira prima TaxID=3034016 RepID=A0ABY8MDX1_9SPIO|nr:YkgJ family cysteine cluster protein [Candidatus Haliotispira prima]